MNFEPGDVLEQAIIGPPVGGLVDLLIDTTHVLWQPDDPAALAELFGFGSVMRTLREERRYREVVMVAPDRSSIVVAPRMMSSDTGHAAREFTGTVVDADDQHDHVRSDAVWSEFSRWLTDVVRTAAMRSEFVVVEMNVPGFSYEPYAMALVRTDHDPAIIQLECNPRPDGSSLWPPGDVPDGQTMTAPLHPDTLAAAGPLIADAVRTWSESAHAVAVTFGSVDQSPLDPDAF